MFKMKYTALAAAAQSSLVATQWPWYLRESANSSAPSYNTTAFSQAEPDSTREVSFAASPNSDEENWTWTLSISDMALPAGLEAIEVPEGALAVDEIDPNARVAYTTYTFGWENSGNINEALAAEQSSASEPLNSCYYAFYTPLPQNVSDAWSASSSSCTSAIGTECEDYILSTFRGAGPIEPGLPGSGQSQPEARPLCRNSAVQSDYASAPECASSFGAVSGFVAIYAIPFANASNPDDENALKEGDTFAWTLSDIYAPDNATTFEMERNRLHMIIIEDNNGAQLLCNRVGDGSDAEEGSESVATRGYINASGAVLAAMVVLLPFW